MGAAFAFLGFFPHVHQAVLCEQLCESVLSNAINTALRQWAVCSVAAL